MKIPNYITQLSRSDLEEIARAANVQPGFGIKVDKVGDALRISIDENDLKRAIWSFNANGGFSAAASDVESVPI